MRMLNLMFALAAGLAVLAGCGQSRPTMPPSTEYQGIKVDWPKLDVEFGQSEPDLRAAADLAKRNIIYSRFPNALMALETLASNPKLTESQKKVVDELMAQTKQVIEKAASAPGH